MPAMAKGGWDVTSANLELLSKYPGGALWLLQAGLGSLPHSFCITIVPVLARELVQGFEDVASLQMVTKSGEARIHYGFANVNGHLIRRYAGAHTSGQGVGAVD